MAFLIECRYNNAQLYGLNSWIATLEILKVSSASATKLLSFRLESRNDLDEGKYNRWLTTCFTKIPKNGTHRNLKIAEIHSKSISPNAVFSLSHLPTGGTDDGGAFLHTSRFASAVILYILLIVATFLIPPMPTGTSYLAGTIEKHRRLDKLLGPKIILVGGSNLAFSMNSPYLSAQMGMPVVNMGLHGGVGLRYMLNEVSSRIGPGDIVIVSPEYDFFWVFLNGSTELLEILYAYPNAVQWLSPEHLPSLFQHYPSLLKRKFDFWSKYGVRNNAVDAVYCRDAFNEYGDVTSVDRLNPKEFQTRHAALNIEPMPLSRSFDQSAFDALNRFSKLCSTRGATAFLTYPPMATERIDLNGNQQNLFLLDSKLRTESGLKVISEPKRYFFPNDQFFDYCYHLRGSARMVRTQRMIDDLHSFLNSRHR